MVNYHAVFEKDGEFWMAYIEEIPGVNTQGKTLEEARKNLREALKLVLEANREIVKKESRNKDVLREELVVA